MSSEEQKQSSWDDLEVELAKMNVEDLIQKVQAVQTDNQTAEVAVNTGADWENGVSAIFDLHSTLMVQHEDLARRQDEEEVEHEKLRQQLQKKKDDATCQHQALLDKLESVRVKLQLNNSKAAKKNFLAKKQEMSGEKSRAEEDRNRLSKELQDTEQKLTALAEEQRVEQQHWKEELEELNREMQRLRGEVTEAQKQAQRDEISVVEKQREVAMAHIDAWQREVNQYLNTLQVECPQAYPQGRIIWEKREVLVRKHQAELQSRFQDVLQLLQQGRDLQTLPRINMPALPEVPTVQQKFNQVMKRVRPPNPPMHQAPINQPFLTQGPPHFYPQRLPPHPQFRVPYNPGPFQSHIRAPVRSASPSPPLNPAAPSPPPPAAAGAPAGKLDKVLERLGSRFPQCNRAQLTSLLQQVKSSRGTLAGMSMEEVMEQVGYKLAQSERLAPGPIGRPLTSGPTQRPPTPRKLCLMCQNHVDPESRHPLSCSHTIHRDCIQVWLQSSRNNSCPFCPAK